MTIDSWFAQITDKLKFKCFKELATVKFSPSLNLKSSKEAAEDTEKLKSKGKKAEIGSYYVNIAEELNDFDEWCISERGIWGIPIPFFVRKDTDEILFDSEIARHVAEIFRRRGGSDAWYELGVEELLPQRYKSEAAQLKKGTHIFDVWFDNSLTWDYTLLRDAHSHNAATMSLNQELA